MYQGRTIMQIAFDPSGGTTAYSTSNPGLSCVNLLSSGPGYKVVVVNVTGTQYIQTTRGSATVTGDPSEPWAALLDGATPLQRN